MKIQIGMLILAAATLGSGCAETFKDIVPLGVVAPPPKEKPTMLVLGEIKVTDEELSEPEQQVMVHAFQMGVEKWCAEHETFKISPSISPTNRTHNAIVLNGTITEINAGSATARILIGMGAGKERITGTFAIDDLDGKSLASFTACKSYLGVPELADGICFQLKT